MSSAEAPRYRADIDGLRAIAVAAVILYHANVPGFGGGYVGVDVFFVVSGYLITQILVDASHLPARTQLAQFYMRRARRILPALLVVSVIAAAVACYVLLPLDLVRFAKYLLATPVFLGNLVSWSNGSYFGSGLSPVGLNHLWSIAIEEQFYLAYPLALILIARYVPRWRGAVLATIAVASLVLCIWGSHEKPVATYYFAPTRAWELLLGAIVAVQAPLRAWPGKRVVREVLACAALVLIVVPVFLYGENMPYPGWYALAPCVATAVLLATGRQGPTLAASVLCWRPLVFTGLISYSLYLWHWPILTLFDYYAIAPATAGIRASLIAATYGIAWLSFRIVERPLRSRRVLGSDAAFVMAAVLVNLCLLAAAIVLLKLDGLPQRFPAEITAIAARQKDLHPDGMRCMSLSREAIREGRLCHFGPTGEQLPKVVVWGDSHALALLPAYEQLAWEHHAQLYLVSTSSCRPLLGIVHTGRQGMWNVSCRRFNDAALEAIRRIEPRRVILGGYWSHVDARLESSGEDAGLPGSALYREGILHTVQRISAPGRSVCVVLGVPTLREIVPYAMAMAKRRGIAPEMIGVTRLEALAEYHDAETGIRELHSRGLLETADPKDALCGGAECLFESHGRPLYRDNNHLSIAGAKFIAPTLEPCFAGLEGEGAG